MKRFSLLLILLLLPFVYAAAQLPYHEVVEYTHKQLKSVGFKYDKKKKQHILQRQNKRNKTSNIFNVIGGNVVGIRPHPNDQYVLRQDDANGDAQLVFVTFYNDDKYQQMLNWIGRERIETSRSYHQHTEQIAFHYQGAHVELTAELVTMPEGSVKAFQEKDLQDEQYHIYTYTIILGEID